MHVRWNDELDLENVKKYNNIHAEQSEAENFLKNKK